MFGQFIYSSGDGSNKISQCITNVWEMAKGFIPLILLGTVAARWSLLYSGNDIVPKKKKKTTWLSTGQIPRLLGQSRFHRTWL
jgi:hypothetical protein